MRRKIRNYGNIFMFSLALISFLIFAGVRIYKGVVFNINCTGYLSRAANANTVDLASAELSTAIDYLKQQKLTEGYTSIFWRSPSEDIGWWFNNLETSLHELKSLPQESSQLERTNVLMKLRETLQDHGSEGSSTVVVPQGITIYPANETYFWWCALSLTFVILFGFFVFFTD